MPEKVIGILGGMGPEATVDCFAKIIGNTPAEKDQDHLRVIIDSNPKVPDRTRAILGEGESPVPVLAEGCKALKCAGADFIIIPCVSAHFFLEELRKEAELPILSIFDVVAETIESEYPDIKLVGLMGTTGTIRGGLFQKRLARSGIDTLVCDENTQQQVMNAIYEIKRGILKQSPEHVKSVLIKAAKSLIDRGSKAIVAGCTEIPLALKMEDLAVPYFDVLALLARAAIRYAGKEPKVV